MQHPINLDKLSIRSKYFSDVEYIQLRELLLKYRKEIFEEHFSNKEDYLRRIPSFLLKKLSNQELDLLEKSNLIERQGGYQYSSQLRVHYIDENNLPFLKEPVIITTDFPLEYTDRVFPWVDEGILTVEKIYRDIDPIKQRVLNMCCGSGTIAILLAKIFQNALDIQIDGVDINPRAREIADFNQKLNGFGLKDSSITINFTTGNMFSELGDSKYDLIVSDPPFALQPPDTSEHDHSKGGTYGEEKTALFLQGVKEHLTAKGEFYLLAYSLGKDPSNNGEIKINELLDQNELHSSRTIPLPDQRVWRFGDRKQVAINPMPVQYMSIRCGDPTYRIAENTDKVDEYIKWIEEKLVGKGWTHLHYLIVHYSSLTK